MTATRKVLSRLRTVITVVLLVIVSEMSSGLSPVSNAVNPVVTVAVYPEEPFVINGDGGRTGFVIDLMSQVAKRAGWTLNYTEITNQSSAALLTEVIAGRADAAAGLISITAERVRTIDFSQPIISGGSQILVPVGTVKHSQPGLKGFLQLLLSKSMFAWLMAALLLTIVPAHVVWVLERRRSEPMFARAYFPGILQAYGWGFSMLPNAADKVPRHWRGRATSVLWAFVCIIFVSYYTAILTSNLTVDKFESNIAGPTDLIGKRVCAGDKSTSAKWLDAIGVPHESVASLSECYAGLGDRYDAVVDASLKLRYFASHAGAGEVEVVGPVFNERDFGVGFRIGSPLRKVFDDALLSMREDGQYDALLEKWLGRDD